MRRKTILRAGVLALCAALLGVPASADDGDKQFNIDGEVRARFEYSENMFDFTDHDNSGDFNDDNYSFWPYRVRIGAMGTFSDDVQGYIEFQNYGFFGNQPPTEAFPDPNLQALSLVDTDDTTLHQGWVQFKVGEAFGARIGRQEHALGNELHMGDNDFYSGLSFDGARAWWDWEAWDLNLFYYNIGEMQASFASCCGSEDATFFGATGTWQLGGDENNVVEPYILNFQNGSVINPVFLDKANFLTAGVRWTHGPSEDNAWDWNVEAAIQNGDIGAGAGEEDHSASVIEAWGGYSWGDDARHRVHLGYLSTSGDDDPADSDHEDYLFLFTDVHANNRLGDMDLETFFYSWGDAAFGPFFAAGVTDINLGYEYWGPDKKHGFMAALHNFTLTEDAQYPADDVGDEIDLRYSYRHTEQLGFELGAAQFSPGDAVELVLGGMDDAMRVWAQAHLRWK